MARPGDDVIRGFKISIAADGVTISVTNGICYIPDTGRLYVDSTMTIVASATSAWLHLYAYINAGIPAIEAVTTIPSDPYQGTARTKSGDTSRRYLGSLYFDSTSKCQPFFHTQYGSQGNRMEFTHTAGVMATHLALLTAGVSQSAVNVLASTVVPTTARMLLAVGVNTSALPVYFSQPEIGAVSATSYLSILNPASSGQLEMLLDTQQRFNYIIGAGVTIGGTVAVRAAGYIFDR